MSTSNRAELITKTQKVLNKHYKPYQPPADRTLLDHLLYACCLENSMPDAADEAFAKLQELFFDWNEVRVTTVTELSQVMSSLQDPGEAAQRIRKTLQAVFEAHYTFEIDFLKKQNLGKSVKDLEKLNALSPFVLSYFTQHGLGGHSIPVNEGALHAMYVTGVIGEKEREQRRVPGLERGVPKTKGIAFASVLHQVGVDFRKSPFTPRIKNILLEINSDAGDRMPKRTSKKAVAEAPKGTKTTTKKADKSAKKTIKKKEVTKKAAKSKTTAPAKSDVKKKAKVAGAKKAAAKKSPAKTTPAKKSSTKKLAKKKPR